MNHKISVDLRNILATLYSDEASIRRIVNDSGIDLLRINFNASVVNIWNSVLTEAEKHQQVEGLLKAVEGEYPRNHEFQAACRAYRQAIGRPADPHPVNVSESPIKPKRRLLALLLPLVFIGAVSGGWYIFDRNYNTPIATLTVADSATPESSIAGVISTSTESLTASNAISLSATATVTDLSSTANPTSTLPETETSADLRVLDNGLTDNTYLIEGESHTQFNVGADLVVYAEPIPGTEVAIALMKVIGKGPNSLTAQAILIDPKTEIRARMRVDDQLTFISQSRLVPVFAYADGYLLREGRVWLRPEHGLTVGAQLQALEFERINGEIIDALRTDSIMQITSMGVDGQVAAVALITGTWPVTGTIVSLVEVSLAASPMVSQPATMFTQTSQLTSAVVGKQVLAINETQRSSNLSDVSLTVTNIELLPEGKMRWNFLFENSSNADKGLAIDFRGNKSYLSDEFGNKYTMLQDTLGGPSRLSQIALQAGVRIKYWIEVEAPKKGAKDFAVVLVMWNDSYPKFQPFICG